MEKEFKPKTFLDRKIQSNRNYFFISYSHADSSLVYEILNELYDKGANFWYDSELSPGDIWNEKVKEKLCDTRCCGIIWFISSSSLNSDAVYKEIQIYDKLKNEMPKLALIPVSFKWTRILDYLKDFNDTTDELFEKINFYNTVTKKSCLIFEKYNNDSIETANNLYKEFQKNRAAQNYNIELRDSSLHEIDNLYNRAGEFYLDVGTYETNIVFENSNNSKDPKINKQIITWKLIDFEDNLYYFVATNCIDFATAKIVDTKLKQLQNQIINDLSCVEKVGLITEKLLTKYSKIIGYNNTTEYANYKRLQPLQLFWFENQFGAKVLYNIKNIKIDREDLDINAGIRPVLVINALKVKREYDK